MKHSLSSMETTALVRSSCCNRIPCYINHVGLETNRNEFLTVLEAGKSKSKAPAKSVSGEDSVSDFCGSGIKGQTSVTQFLLCPQLLRETRLLPAIFFITAPVPFMRAPPSRPNRLPKGPPLTPSHWASGFWHRNLGDTNIKSIATTDPVTWEFRWIFTLPNPHAHPGIFTLTVLFILNSLYLSSISLSCYHCLSLGSHHLSHGNFLNLSFSLCPPQSFLRLQDAFCPFLSHSTFHCHPIWLPLADSGWHKVVYHAVPSCSHVPLLCHGHTKSLALP